MPISSGKVVAAPCGVLLESVTAIVTLYVPAKPVVPLIKPVEGLPLMPRGSELKAQVNGGVPPDICGWKLYGTFCIPLGRDVVMMVRVLGPTVKGQVVAAATPLASFT